MHSREWNQSTNLIQIAIIVLNRATRNKIYQRTLLGLFIDLTLLIFSCKIASTCDQLICVHSCHGQLSHKIDQVQYCSRVAGLCVCYKSDIYNEPNLMPRWIKLHVRLHCAFKQLVAHLGFIFIIKLQFRHHLKIITFCQKLNQWAQERIERFQHVVEWSLEHGQQRR